MNGCDELSIHVTLTVPLTDSTGLLLINYIALFCRFDPVKLKYRKD